MPETENEIELCGQFLAYGVFLLLVIGGSFCMLNLTVATVGQTFTIVKKEAESKRAIKGDVASWRPILNFADSGGGAWVVSDNQRMCRCGGCATSKDTSRAR